MNHINPKLGLHGLGQNDSFQWTHLTEQCQEIIRHLDELIAVSEDKVPMRQGNFDLPNHAKGKVPRNPGVNDLSADQLCGLMSERMRERVLEHQILLYGKDEANAPVLAGVCTKIQAYQVPLCRANAPKGTNHGWKAIDLLGSTSHGLPVIFELKLNHAENPKRGNETPLRMIVEAAAYGVALRKMWQEEKSPFKRAWHDDLKLSIDENELNPCQLVGLAPQAYWDRALGKCGKRGTALKGFWPAFEELRQELTSRGFPVSLAGIHQDKDAHIAGLKIIEVPRD